MYYYDAYAKPLELLRKKNGFTKTHVAKHVDVSASTVSNHERGRTTPDLRTIVHYCKFYKIGLPYFYQLVAYYQGLTTDTKVDVNIRDDVALGMVMEI